MNTKIFYFLVAIVVFLGLGIIGWQRYVTTPPVEEAKIFKVGLLQMAPIVSQNIDGFKAGMEELGYKEGVNIQYVYRDAQGDLDLLDQYARELVSIKPDLVFVNTSPATLAIKQATEGTGIPVVFSMVADPLGAGFVDSIQSSGNNLSGTSCAYIDVAPKRLEVLAETFPWAEDILVLYRPEDKSAGPCTERILSKADELGLNVTAHPIKKKEDIEAYLKTLEEGDYDAVMDPGDSMVSSAMNTLVEYSYWLKMPYFALSKGEVEAGAVAGYAVDYFDLGKQSSLIANQILAGVDPANIPIEMPRRWFYAINLEAAEKIGIEIPEEAIQSANLVIK